MQKGKNNYSGPSSKVKTALWWEVIESAVSLQIKETFSQSELFINSLLLRKSEERLVNPLLGGVYLTLDF